MPWGDFAGGLSDAFSEYVTSERKRQRDAEDAQLNEHMALIHSLLQSPNLNPNVIGKALTDLANFQSAKANRKLKPGGEGFMGAHELPVSQLLSGLQQGTMPAVGRTYDTVQSPKQVSGEGPTPLPQPHLMSMEGAAIPNPPMPETPQPYTGDASKVVQAAQDVKQYGMGGHKPVANQPLFRDPEEMYAEQAGRQGAEAEAKRRGEFAANRANVHDMMGLPPEERDLMMQTSGFHNPAKPTGGQIRAGTIDGKPATLIFDPTTKVITDYATGQPVTGEIALGSGSSASPFSQHLVQQPDGSYTAIWVPKNPLASPGNMTPGMTGGANDIPMPPGAVMSKPTGVVGRVPPAPQAQTVVVPITNPDGTQGSAIVDKKTAIGKPVQLPNGAQRGNRVTMSAAGKQAMTGLNVLDAVIPDIEAAINQMGAPSNNPVGQVVDLALAKRGISPGQLEEQLLQLLGIADAYGLRGLMGGRPNQKMMDIVRVHLPQPGDSTLIAMNKLHTLKYIIPKLRIAINNAEMNPGGGGSAPAAGGTAAPAEAGPVWVRGPNGRLMQK